MCQRLGTLFKSETQTPAVAPTFAKDTTTTLQEAKMKKTEYIKVPMYVGFCKHKISGGHN